MFWKAFVLAFVSLLAVVGIAGTAVFATLYVTKDSGPSRADVAATAAAVEPDRVVGIELRCTLTENVVKTWDFRGDVCRSRFDPFVQAAPSSFFIVKQQELTIRTALGTTYTVRVEMNPIVSIGDPWPPP